MRRGRQHVVQRKWRAVKRQYGAVDLVHERMFVTRKPGDLVVNRKSHGSVREDQGRNPDVYDNEKSDKVIVSKKETNNEY